MGLGNKPRLFCKKGNVVKVMKLELKDLEMLMEKFESSSLSEMSVSDGDFKFAFKKNTQSDCIKKTNIESATSALNTEPEA
jgi:acetyl-CoA carboxylase biotin carboxyl carrier protein